MGTRRVGGRRGREEYIKIVIVLDVRGEVSANIETRMPRWRGIMWEGPPQR